MKTQERNQRYKKVLSLRSKDLTFAEIGEELGISRQRAHQLYLDALNDGTPVKRSRTRPPRRKKIRPLRIAL